MAGQEEDSLHDGAIGWGILAVVFAVLIWLFWYFFHTEIRDAVRWYRYMQMWLMSFFIDQNQTVNHQGNPINWHQGFDYSGQLKPEKLNYGHLSLFNTLTLSYLKYVYAGIMMTGAYWCMFHGPASHFRKKHGLEGLIQYQSQNFPVIAPFQDFNPATQPARPPGSPVPAELPSFSEALGPEEWLAYNQIPAPDGKLDKDATYKAFLKQLGGRWKGAKALKPYQQILLAAFALKASRKRNDADAMLGRLAVCWNFKNGLQLSKDKSLLREAQKILRNKDLASKTLAECNKHAFITTALLRALAFAREEGGVLAPAQFVWLRGYDRALWYPLNNLGRQSYHAEAFGAMAHYKAERMTKRPIPVPKIEDAVNSMAEYMQSTSARPIPALDYSASEKQRGVKKAI